MVDNYTVVYTKTAQKDALKLVPVGLKDNAMELIAVLKENPFKNPPPYEKLQGNLSGFYSRRSNIRHRLVYQVFEEEKLVKVVRMWTHYD